MAQWRAVIMPEMVWCWQPSRMWRALSEWWQRGHRWLVNVL